MTPWRPAVLVTVWAMALIGTACAPAASSPLDPPLTDPGDLTPVALAPDEKLRAIATTSIVADVVGRIGGEQVDLHVLVPLGVDPHAFEPTPRDAQALTEADVVFINGFGLETFLGSLLRDAGAEAPIVSLSLGLQPRPFAGEGDEGPGVDPHTWLDPNNVVHWTENIEGTLVALDPAHGQAYAANADEYRRQLAALDQEIWQAVSRIPTENRKLVTDHDELGYFADRYGFRIVGAVIPGASSLAEASAAQLAELSDRIQAEGVPAVFVSSVVNPTLVETFAGDAGIDVIPLYAHSLTEGGGAAPSYLELMRYNAETIAAALTP